jgi:hypothetical protein
VARGENLAIGEIAFTSLVAAYSVCALQGSFPGSPPLASRRYVAGEGIGPFRVRSVGHSPGGAARARRRFAALRPEGRRAVRYVRRAFPLGSPPPRNREHSPQAIKATDNADYQQHG